MPPPYSYKCGDGRGDVGDSLRKKIPQRGSNTRRRGFKNIKER